MLFFGLLLIGQGDFSAPEAALCSNFDSQGFVIGHDA